MAGLDPRYICTSDLDTYYVDKTSGGPMSGGIVTFYSDVNRSILKPVYQLTGSPPNYSYAVLPNPCTLSPQGTFQDGLGNNIVPFYYPFTGTPAQNTGVQELYYITVVNSGLTPQLTRQGWPSTAANEGPVNDNNTLENFIPNGQFLARNNIVSITEPPITQISFGAQTVDLQAIAQGGWYFAYTDGNSATFTNSFSGIPSSGGWGINSFPAATFNFQCTSFNANALTRDLWITWPDVNKFSAVAGSPPVAQPYTLFFDAKSNDSNSYTFTLYQIYYFGSGGSPSAPIVTQLGSPIVITPSFQSFNIPIASFPGNQGTLGTNNDSFVAIGIRGPSSTWNAEFSDFALLSGTQTLSAFPTLTNAEMLSTGVAGFMPTPSPTGNDIGLPLILTAQGLAFDHGVVGEIVGRFSTTAASNEVLMDGSIYSFTGYNSSGIPYSRLGSFLIANSPVANTPMWGTGANFATVFAASATTFTLSINTSGGITVPTSSSAAITFTGSDPTYTFTVASVPGSAAYFTFVTNPSSPATYYVWFNTGSSVDPAPGGTGIIVSITGSDTTTTVTTKILIAINKYQFVVFNAKGYFLRGLDPSATTDPGAASRTIAAIAYTGAGIGTIELAAFVQHTHAFAAQVTNSALTFPNNGAYTTQGGSSTGDIMTYSTTTAGTAYLQVNGTSANASTGGGNETRPVNLAVNWFIKL